MRSTYHPSPPATTQPETAATTGLAQHACLTWSASRPGRGFGFRLGRRVEGCAKELELISWLNNAIVRWESCARNQSEAPHLYTAQLLLTKILEFASQGLSGTDTNGVRRMADATEYGQDKQPNGKRVYYLFHGFAIPCLLGYV